MLDARYWMLDLNVGRWTAYSRKLSELGARHGGARPRRRRVGRLLFPLSLRFQHLDERFLRNVDLPDAFHSFLSFFLFLQQLAFPCDIAAVAFRGHIFSQGRNALPRNNLSADRRLNRDLV